MTTDCAALRRALAGRCASAEAHVWLADRFAFTLAWVVHPWPGSGEEAGLEGQALDDPQSVMALGWDAVPASGESAGVHGTPQRSRAS